MKLVSWIVCMAGALIAQEDGPQCKDRTGIAWVHPFPEALAKAKKTGRLLMIKPIAFGTTADGGW